MTNDMNRFEAVAGPSSVREALDEFKEVQSRRVAHWKEYEEAMAHYERTDLPQYGKEAQSDDKAHRCGAPPSSDGRPASDHYRSAALPMTDAILSKVMSLVTSGLLDCSHCVRTIETELRGNLRSSQLADLVGNVQDQENKVLRTIVQRDQNKRIGKLEGRDMSEDIQQANEEVIVLRRGIQDLMSEINAELADL